MRRRDRLISALRAAACAAAFLCTAPAGRAQQNGLPPGPLQQKAQRACLGCHTVAIIVQQQLDRHVWTKEMDKMIRWGAPVAPEDREALIDYFVQHYGPRPESSTEAKLAPGPGAAKVRAACLGCHGAGVIADQHLDQAGWEAELDKMVRWGAAVRAENRAAILKYLARHYPAEGEAAPTARHK